MKTIQELFKQFDKLYFSKDNEKHRDKPIRCIEVDGKLITQEDYVKQELFKQNI